MIFWASVETEAASYVNVRKVRKYVEPALNDALSASSLAGIDAEIRYIPIVMSADALARFPARSRLRKKERVYVCAPQLDFETFVSGSWSAQITCYLDGLRECARRLPELGASKAQAQEFLDILERLKAAGTAH